MKGSQELVSMAAVRAARLVQGSLLQELHLTGKEMATPIASSVADVPLQPLKIDLDLRR